MDAGRGDLVITSEALYFTASGNTKKIGLGSVVTVENYDDGIIVTPSRGKMQIFLLDEPVFAANLLLKGRSTIEDTFNACISGNYRRSTNSRGRTLLSLGKSAIHEILGSLTFGLGILSCSLAAVISHLVEMQKTTKDSIKLQERVTAAFDRVGR